MPSNTAAEVPPEGFGNRSAPARPKRRPEPVHPDGKGDLPQERGAHSVQAGDALTLVIEAVEAGKGKLKKLQCPDWPFKWNFSAFHESDIAPGTYVLEVVKVKERGEDGKYPEVTERVTDPDRRVYVQVRGFSEGGE